MSTHHVLFVDDEANILKTLRRVTADEPYEVHTAESAVAGLALLEQTPCQLVVSDYRMTEVSGNQFLQAVREKWPGSVRILLTGYADFTVAMEAINTGHIYKLISKPWNDIELRQEIRKALEYYDLVQLKAQQELEIRRKNAELERWNTRLEELVCERTTSLRTALAEKAVLLRELDDRVKELEIRDRMLQHLLEVHPVDDTLALTVESILQLVETGRIAIYLAGDVASILHLRVLWEKDSGRILLGGNDVDAARQSGAVPPFLELPAIDSELNPSLFPIRKGGQILGMLLVEKPGGVLLTSREQEVIDSIAVLSAVAVTDDLFSRNFTLVNEQIATILKDQ